MQSWMSVRMRKSTHTHTRPPSSLSLFQSLPPSLPPSFSLYLHPHPPLSLIPSLPISLCVLTRSVTGVLEHTQTRGFRTHLRLGTQICVCTHILTRHRTPSHHLQVLVCECADGPLLGCAVLAAASAGLHGGDVRRAAGAMVRVSRRLDPVAAKSAVYDAVYAKYRQLAPALRPLEPFDSAARPSAPPPPPPPGSIIVAPSVLASDWSDMRSVLATCEAAARGAPMWLHVDMFDGVAIDSAGAFTFGPEMVGAMRKHTQLLLDVHLVVDRPDRYVHALVRAGADRVQLQWETFAAAGGGGEAKLLTVARELRAAGVAVGVCIAPETEVGVLREVLAARVSGGSEGKHGSSDGAAGQAWLLDVVNLLGVNTGFGGQAFQRHTLDKITAARRLLADVRRDESEGAVVMVDGGINAETARECAAAGAGALVAGSFVFKHPDGVDAAVRTLREAAASGLADSL